MGTETEMGIGVELNMKLDGGWLTLMQHKSLIFNDLNIEPAVVRV